MIYRRKFGGGVEEKRENGLNCQNSASLEELDSLSWSHGKEMCPPSSLLKVVAPRVACNNTIVLLRQFDGALTCEVGEEADKDGAKLGITKGHAENHIFTRSLMSCPGSQRRSAAFRDRQRERERVCVSACHVSPSIS